MLRPRSIAASGSLALTLVCAAPASPASPASPQPARTGVVTRVDVEGRPLWRAAPAVVASAAEGEGETLAAGPWLPPLPELEIPLFDGGSFRTADARGDVLLLDFWATWCEPCLEELPRLQRLEDEWGERGLRIVTVNSGEPAAIALDFLDALGIELPAGIYDDAVREAVPVRALPTLLLVDRDGRMVQRWSGYAEELVDEVAARVAGLLDRDPGRREPIARVAAVEAEPAGRLEVAWARRVAGVAGVAVLPPTEDGRRAVPQIAVGTDGGVLLLDGRGERLRRASADAAAGTLVRGPAGASDGLVGFRPGGRRVVALDAALDGAGRDVPSYVLDAVLGPGADGTPVPWAATVDGLFRATADGWVLDGAPGEVRALAATGRTLVAVRAPATLERRGADGASSVELPFDTAWRLAIGPGDALIVGDGGVVGLATPRLGGDVDTVAVATGDGRLELLRLDDGRAIHRSSWHDPLTAVAAGDLDSDGIDELVVGAGPRVVALRWRAR